MSDEQPQIEQAPISTMTPDIVRLREWMAAKINALAFADLVTMIIALVVISQTLPSRRRRRAKSAATRRDLESRGASGLAPCTMWGLIVYGYGRPVTTVGFRCGRTTLDGPCTNTSNRQLYGWTCAPALRLHVERHFDEEPVILGAEPGLESFLRHDRMINRRRSIRPPRTVGAGRTSSRCSATCLGKRAGGVDGWTNKTALLYRPHESIAHTNFELTWPHLSLARKPR